MATGHEPGERDDKADLRPERYWPGVTEWPMGGAATQQCPSMSSRSRTTALDSMVPSSSLATEDSHLMGRE